MYFSSCMFVQFYVFPPKWQKKSLLTIESYQMIMEVTDLFGFLSNLIFTTIHWFLLFLSDLDWQSRLWLSSPCWGFTPSSSPLSSTSRSLKAPCCASFASSVTCCSTLSRLERNLTRYLTFTFSHICPVNVSVFLCVFSLYVSFLKHPRSLNAFLLSLDLQSYKTGDIPSTHCYSTAHYSFMETYHINISESL